MKEKVAKTKRATTRILLLFHLQILLLLFRVQVNAEQIQSNANSATVAEDDATNVTAAPVPGDLPSTDSEELKVYNESHWAQFNSSKKDDIPEVKGNTSSRKSLFEKFVNLVSPSAMSTQNSKDGMEEAVSKGGEAADAVPVGGEETQSMTRGLNVSEANNPTELLSVDQASDHVNAVQIDTNRSESELLDMSKVVMQEEIINHELNEPMDIDTEIFPEMISSIQPSGECADVCTIHTCNGHGVCTMPACTCNCTEGYTGLQCSQKVAMIANFQIRPGRKPCPDNCAGQGDCLENGTCSCHRGWAGYNCSIECMGGVANPCSGHGTCLAADGKCLCQDGYAGKNCTRRNVPQDINKYREMVLGEQVLGEESKTEGKDETLDSKANANSQNEVPGDMVASEAKKIENGQTLSTNTTVPPSPNGIASQDGASGPQKDEASAANPANHTLTSTGNNATAAVNISKSKSIASPFVRGVQISREALRKLGVNHAAFDLGGKALASNKEARGESALLKNDRDKYWISPCKVDKGALWIVVELNEIINVNKIVLGSFEFYSSTVKDFQVLTQLVYPTDHWNLLGYFQALPSRQYQEFVVKSPMMAKFLKIRVLTHHGNEFYCTLSSIQVYGTTQWEEMGRMLDENEHHVDIVKRALVGGDSADAGKERQDVQKEDLIVNASKNLNMSKNESSAKIQNVSTKVSASKNATKGVSTHSAGNTSRGVESPSKGDRGTNATDDQVQGDGAVALDSDQGKDAWNQTRPIQNLSDSENSSATESSNVSDWNKSALVRSADSPDESRENSSETTSIFAKFVNLVKRKSDEADHEGSQPRESPQPRDVRTEPEASSGTETSPTAENQQRDRSGNARQVERNEEVLPETQPDKVESLSETSNPLQIYHGTRIDLAESAKEGIEVAGSEHHAGPADFEAPTAFNETDHLKKKESQQRLQESAPGGGKNLTLKVAERVDLDVDHSEQTGNDSSLLSTRPSTPREESDVKDTARHASSSEEACLHCSDSVKGSHEEEAVASSVSLHPLPLRGESTSIAQPRPQGHGDAGADSGSSEVESEGDGVGGAAGGDRSMLELRKSEDADETSRNSSCEVPGKQGKWNNSLEELNEGDEPSADPPLEDHVLHAMTAEGELSNVSSPSDAEGDPMLHNVTAEGEEQAVEEEKKLADEQRKRLVEEQRRVAMGLISSPSRVGELSFFHKVPEKIKMLEINHSFLQSYMEETKKQYDETFEDLQTDIKTLQSATSDVRGDLSAITTNLTERIKSLENHSAVLEAKFAEHSQRMVEQLRELEALRAFNERNLFLLQAILALLVVGLFLQQGKSRVDNVSYLRRAWLKMISSDWRYFGLIQGLLKLFGFRPAHKVDFSSSLLLLPTPRPPPPSPPPSPKPPLQTFFALQKLPTPLSFAPARVFHDVRSQQLGLAGGARRNPEGSEYCRSSFLQLQLRDDGSSSTSQQKQEGKEGDSFMQQEVSAAQKILQRAKVELSSAGHILEERGTEIAASAWTDQ
eukprot:84717-Hanusia_phi.AAC.1